jgi:hypothetical protein
MATKTATAYGREALSEWSNAIRYGGRALAEGLRERRHENGNGNGNGNGSGAVPFPIQESIDVAVPLGGAFELCSQFLDFPDYLERVEEVEEGDESHFTFVVKLGRRRRELEVEIADEREDERIEWECDGELAHEGLVTFHPLAPRLTRLEMTIERRPEGMPERLARQIHLPSRVIQAELHRFKAHAELLDEDFEDYVGDQEQDLEEDQDLDEEQDLEQEQDQPS